MTTGMEEGTAQQRYEQLVPLREPFLRRARECAKLTIPYLMPPEGFNETQSLPTPYQSFGARGVRALSAKLLLALFPPNAPFFKYSLDDFMKNALTQGQLPRGEVEKALSSRERATMLEMESSQFRICAGTSLQHLLVAGNFLVHIPPKGLTRGFRLDQFVVKRDASGNVLEIVVKESVAPNTLPAPVREAATRSASTNGSDQKTVDLYTHVTRTADRWEVYQEAGGIKIKKSVGFYPLDRLPWVPLRLVTQPGEDYGRSYVEEFLGDLDSLEGLTETLVEGSAAAARVIFLVRPNGVTKVHVIAKARTGDVRAGNAEDVGVVRTDKQADLRVAKEMASEIATRLSYAFLLNTAVQRQAERVTAEEIRFMASELDDALGGVYALLSAEFQLPVVTIFEHRMEKARRLPPMPKGATRPVITTGIEALGRGIDLRNLRAFTADVIGTLGPEIAMRYLVATEYIKRAAASYGIDTEGFVKTDEQIQQEEQFAQLVELLRTNSPEILKQFGGLTKEVVKGQIQKDIKADERSQDKEAA